MTTKSATRKKKTRRAYVFAVVGLAIFLVGLAFWRRPPIVFSVQGTVALENTDEKTDSALALASFERELRSASRLFDAAEKLGLTHEGEAAPIVDWVAQNLVIETAPSPEAPVTFFKLGVETTDPTQAVALVQYTIESAAKDFDFPDNDNHEEVEAARYRVALARETVARTQRELEAYLTERIEDQTLPISSPAPVALDPDSLSQHDSPEPEIAEFASEPNQMTMPVANQLDGALTQREAQPDAEQPPRDDAPAENPEPADRVEASVQEPEASPGNYQQHEQPVMSEEEPSPSDQLPGHPAMPEDEPAPADDRQPDDSGDHTRDDPTTSENDRPLPMPTHDLRPLILERNSDRRAGDDCENVEDSLGQHTPIRARRRSPDLAETADRRSPESPYNVASGDLRSERVRGPETLAQQEVKFVQQVRDSLGQYTPKEPRRYRPSPIVVATYEQAEPVADANATIESRPDAPRSFDATETGLDDDPELSIRQREVQRAQEELSAALASERNFLSGTVRKNPEIWVAEPAFVANRRGQSITTKHLLALLGLSLVGGTVFALLYQPGAANLLSTSREVASATSLPIVATLGRNRLAWAAARKNRQCLVKWSVIAAECVVAITIVVMICFSVAERSFASRIVKNPIAAYTEAVERVVETTDGVKP